MGNSHLHRFNYQFNSSNITVLYMLADLGFDIYKGHTRNSQFPQDQGFTAQISKLKPKHGKGKVTTTEKCQSCEFHL